jgi:hypothetical protein
MFAEPLHGSRNRLRQSRSGRIARGFWFQRNSAKSGKAACRVVAATQVAITYSDSLRTFFRARFRAKACFTRRFAPGFK